MSYVKLDVSKGHVGRRRTGAKRVEKGGSSSCKTYRYLSEWSGRCARHEDD